MKAELTKFIIRADGKVNARLTMGSPEEIKLRFEKYDQAKLHSWILKTTSGFTIPLTFNHRVFLCLNGITEERICKIDGCGKPCMFTREDGGPGKGYVTKYSEYCSKAHGSKATKKGFARGDEKKIQQKRSQTMLRTRGYEFNSQRPEVKTILKDMMTTRNPMDNNETRLRVKATTHRIHGITPEQSDFLSDEKFPGHFQRYHVGEKMSCAAIADMIGLKSAQLIELHAERHGLKILYFGKSKEHMKLSKWLQGRGVKFEDNNHEFLGRKELDIYCPDHKVAIEVNGLWTHSYPRKDEKYHLDKTTQCEAQGIRLLHFYDYEINEKFDIVTSIIASVLGESLAKEYARKCQIVELSTEDARNFLNDNHIQGYQSSGTVSLALTNHDGHIVACMTFGKARFNRNIQWELIRFCNARDTNVVGGFSRLLQYFIATYKPTSIMTYADRRLFTGDVYGKNQFVFSHATPPNHWYFSGDEYYVHHRHGFKRSNLAKKLEEYDSKLTIEENMEVNGWLKIYDCGTTVWTWGV